MRRRRRAGLAVIVRASGAGFVITALVLVFRSEMAAGLKFFLGVGLSGFALLFLTTLRGRLRTLPYDPYTQVKR